VNCRGVMIVEDDDDIRETIEQVLADYEVPAILAENGAVALDRLRTADPQPCVILLDMMMPVMDGREFRTKQQEDPAIAEIPVVVLSAHVNGDRCAEELHADGYLKKPCDLATLLATIRKFTPAPS
jgi:CheY-like chemotaxis protein